MHIAGQAVAALIARVGQACAVVQREVYGLGVDHLAPLADIGGITGGQNARHIVFVHQGIVQLDLARKAIAARFTARETGDHMIHPHIRHFLCGLHRRANGAFGFVHGADLAKAHPARAGRGRPDDAEVRLTRH